MKDKFNELDDLQDGFDKLKDKIYVLNEVR